MLTLTTYCQRHVSIFIFFYYFLNFFTRITVMSCVKMIQFDPYICL